MSNSLEFILTDNNAIRRDGINITIPAIVLEAQRRGSNELTRVFLNHQESPIAIAGVGQLREDDEVRRPDPGGLFFHGNGASRCYMTTQPKPSTTNGKFYSTALADEFMKMLLAYSPEIVAGDMDASGKRLVSLSHRFGAHTWMSRACWYEQAIDSEVMARIEQSGKSSLAHQERIQPLPGLYDLLTTRYAPTRIAPKEFVSPQSIEHALTLQYRPARTTQRDACVTRS